MSTSKPEETAEQLAVLAQDGCLASFEELIRKFQTPIYSYVLQLTRDSHEAEDIAQETFIKAYQHLARYNPIYRFSPWLFAIAKNTACSHLRKRKPSEPIHEMDEFLPAAEADTPDDTIWLHARKLKPKLFEVLWLHYGEDFSMKEIAAITGSNTLYIKVLLHRARKELKRKLECAAYPNPGRCLEAPNA